KRLKRRIERGQVSNAPPHAAESGQDRVVAVVQRTVAFAAQPLDSFGARQHLFRRVQTAVFISHERGPIELAELELKELLPRPAIGSRLLDTRTLVRERAQGCKCERDGSEEFAQPAERIQNGKVRRRIEEGVVFVLAVELDQTARQVAKCASRRQFAV